MRIPKCYLRPRELDICLSVAKLAWYYAIFGPRVKVVREIRLFLEMLYYAVRYSALW